MKIATKLVLFFTCVVILFILLAGALTRQAQTVADGYDALLANPVREAEMARVVQVNFKKQVQEWKDILLRGHNPEDLAKYTRQFHVEESEVRQGAQALADTLQNAQARELVLRFLAAHQKMSEKYQAAYAQYVSGNFDFKAADTMVRGQDREATDLFDRVVATLEEATTNAVAAQKAAVEKSRTFTMAAATALLAALGLAGFLTVSSILRRLGKLQAVADRLAVADVEGLSIDISGADEIGSFGESMKGVHAAIEELSRLAAASAK